MRARKVAALIVSALLLTTIATTTASGASDQDQHSDNIKQLAQVPMKMGGTALAEGSDLAFRGNLLFAGSYQGMGIYRILPNAPYLEQVSFFHCAGAQGDIVLWKHYAFLALDSGSSEVTNVCNNTNDSAGKEGVRIVDISDIRQPRQVGFVETDCGSHTHSLLPQGNTAYIYVQSYPLGAQTDSCSVASHRKISIIKVPGDDPASAKVTSTFDVTPEIGCHDVDFFPAKHIAAAACIGESQIWDVKDPEHPELISRIYNPAIQIHHSAAITWDGKVLALGDEMLGSVTGTCPGIEQGAPGAIWFYDITDPANPVLKGHFNTPRNEPPDSVEEAAYTACTTHNYGIVPMMDPKKYIVTIPYRASGLSVVDFSDPANPKELAYYVQLNDGNIPDIWCAYWYNGRIYTNDNAAQRGVSVYEMEGLGTADAHSYKGIVNPQTQIASFR